MSRSHAAVTALAATILSVAIVSQPFVAMPPAPSPVSGSLALPSPRTRGSWSLEETLVRRRSIREFSPDGLTAGELGQLLWAAQGVTDAEGRRTAPSAGALYPLELYAVTPDGVFHYLPVDHTLVVVRRGDVRPQLRRAALDQDVVEEAPAVIVVTGVIGRTSAKYGAERATRYVHLEAGHAAQNLLLEAVALGLGAVPIGAFDDGQVRSVLGLSADETPLYLLPVGHPG